MGNGEEQPKRLEGSSSAYITRILLGCIEQEGLKSERASKVITRTARVIWAALGCKWRMVGQAGEYYYLCTTWFSLPVSTIAREGEDWIEIQLALPRMVRLLQIPCRVIWFALPLTSTAAPLQLIISV